QVGIGDDFAQCVVLAALRVDPATLRRPSNPLLTGGHVGAVVRDQKVAEVPGDQHSRLRGPDARLEGLSPRDGAVTAQSLVQACHRARHAHALVAAVVYPAAEHIAVAVRGLPDEEVRPLVLPDSGPGTGVELNQLLPSLAGKVEQHHARAPDAA